jgi:hypothetical protein
MVAGRWCRFTHAMRQLAEPHMTGVLGALQLLRAWNDDIPRGTVQ